MRSHPTRLIAVRVAHELRILQVDNPSGGGKLAVDRDSCSPKIKGAGSWGWRGERGDSRVVKSALSRKSIYTTGEAARICQLSVQTIIRCVDTGRLKGFRAPGSRWRSIRREDLLEFMRAHGLPT